MGSSRPARRWAASLAALTLVALSSALGAAPAQATPGEYWVQRLELPKVWKITRGAGVTVAVVDTGVPPTVNLRGRLLKGVDLITHGPNGQRDSGETTPYGPVSHGQEMAELIAGDSSGGLTQGIATKATILPVKSAISGPTTSPDAGYDVGIRWGVDHGATVINASFGEEGASCTPGDEAAVKYAYDHDVIVVAAVGNMNGPVSSPADCPGALAVAGVTSDGANWSGSDFGPQVDVANFATKIQFVTLNGNPVGGNGTSSAAAFTSGEIALLRARFPKDTARQIITRLLYGIDPLSKTPIGQRVDDHIGYGVPAIYSELTAKVPANAPNPIYDAWTKALGAPSTGSPAPGRSPAASSAPGGSVPSSSTPLATDHGSSGGPNSALIIAVVVVVVLLIIVVAVVLTRRTKARKGPYPPAGYGPPSRGGPPSRPSGY